MSRTELFAPAKVNLWLEIVGRRDDGYHRLDSLVVFAGVGDGLTCEAAEAPFEFVIDGPFAADLPADESNLVVKAARRLAHAAGIEPRGRLLLTKRLPIASGIGGGSADAAAALRGLNTRWGLGWSGERLRALGLELGADIPVCLFGKPAHLSGIGEILAPAPILPPAWLVLVNPGLALGTRAVFLARDPGFTEPAPLPSAPTDAEALAAMLRVRRNDLEPAAIRLAPPIADVLEALRALPDCRLARMSGSGATCFGLFGEEEPAVAAATHLAGEHPDWWCVAAPVLG